MKNTRDKTVIRESLINNYINHLIRCITFKRIKEYLLNFQIR